MQEKQNEQAAPDLIQQDAQRKNYGGVGRLAYILGILGVFVIIVIIEQIESWFAFFGHILALILCLGLVVDRLHNIGMSGWWSLLILVPIANFFIWARCLICPEGYQDTRKLDMAGKVIFGFIIALSITVFVLGMISFFRIIY